jgi:uncharacterized membrane protein
MAAATGLVAAGAWFVYLQLFVIKLICPFCMAAHACGLLLGIIIAAITLSERVENRELRESATHARSAPWIFGGLVPVVLLALGQVISPPRTFTVTSSTDLAGTKTHRILQLAGGAFELDLSDVPLHGSSEATCVIVHLFDYSCPHCRALHPILVEACRRLTNQLAIVSLPMPLATNCNWVLKHPIPAHVNACAYANSGLAVWRANPAKLSAFDDWFFAPKIPPTPERTESEAMQLVGTNEYKQALSDPWIQKELAFSIRLYATNYYRYNKQVLPELMIGTNLISGQVPSVDTLYKLVAAQFNIRPPDISTN